MTLVRRNARTSKSCPNPATQDIWEQISPSRQAYVKAETAKQYFNDHYNKLFEEQMARSERLRHAKEFANEKYMTEEEKKEFFEEFEREEAKITRLSRNRLKPSRFERIKLIGRGGFGEVWLVRDKLTADYHALKVLKKADVILGDQVENVRTERDILCSSNSPWFTNLHYSFQDEERLYLVLEYVPGGDLMNALIKKNVFDEKTARFFAGEIALAVNTVHEMHFLHRDLKPDNILITETGHIKLTDFGLSKNYGTAKSKYQALGDTVFELVQEQTNFVCHKRGAEFGTYLYAAPELIKHLPATPLSDFWSLGVILYEMLYGATPFVGQSMRETALRIIHWPRALRFPDVPGVSAEAVDLMKHLLCEPEDRYGFSQIVAHPFFKGFDFTNYARNEPPLVPVLRHPTDTRHFDDIPPAEETLASEVPLAEINKFAFAGFTYKKRPTMPL